MDFTIRFCFNTLSRSAPCPSSRCRRRLPSRNSPLQSAAILRANVNNHNQQIELAQKRLFRDALTERIRSADVSDTAAVVRQLLNKHQIADEHTAHDHIVALRHARVRLQ